MTPSGPAESGPDRRRKDVFAVIIPVFNHGSMVASVVEKALALDMPVIVVDDGTTDASIEPLDRFDNVEVLHHGSNQGKGEAILTGFERAAEFADWAVTMDADGQHNPEDAITLVQAIPDNTRSIMVGARQGMSASHVPWSSRFGRTFSNFWVRLSGGPPISDTQSGFRIYPLPESMALKTQAGGYQFELEILVKAYWSGIPVIEAPVSVTYAQDGTRVSHFRPFVDFMRNARTFSRLITYRLLIRPFSTRYINTTAKNR